MAKKYGHSATMGQGVWKWLVAYKEAMGLRSVSQAIEFIIKEAGYDWTQPLPKTLTPKNKEAEASA